MPKLLAVFGATGQQGGSVIDYVLNDPVLSKEFTIRACTRDPAKPASKKLSDKGVETVQCDFSDPDSVKMAVAGAHTVFANTVSIYDRATARHEFEQGKIMADASVAAGVAYYIWSSSTHVNKNSGGKLTEVSPFDVKAEVEDYIRSLPIKSMFYVPASFMQNFATLQKPRPTGEGNFIMSGIFEPTTLVPYIDIQDTGKWIAPFLSDPEKYVGKALYAAYKFYTLPEVAEIISRATGKKVEYKQLPDEVYQSFLPQDRAQMILQMNQYFRDYGYYGPVTKEDLDWSAKQVHGTPNSLEEFLVKNPLSL